MRLAPKVLVDARLVHRRQTGVATYIRELRSAFGDLEPDSVQAYFATGPPGLPRRNRLTRIGNLVLDLAWLHVGVPLIARRRKAEIIHAPVNWLPWWSPTRSIVTVQDVAWERVPETYPEFFRQYARLFTRRSVHRADVVITTSQSTADDLVELYDVHPGKIAVIPIGVTAEESVSRDEREPFILHVGEFEPRKRVLQLIEGHRRYVANAAPGTETCRLVLAGSGGRLESDVAAAAGEDCSILGFVSVEQLREQYRRARLVVMPSEYEGFGLPVAEAMAHGCPVLVADNSSLVEVAGPSGLVIDRPDADGIATALAGALADPEALRDCGYRAWVDARQRFSWSLAARRTAEIYGRVAA